MLNLNRLGSRVSALGVALLFCMMIGCEQAPSWLNRSTIQSQLQGGLNKLFSNSTQKANLTNTLKTKTEQALDAAVIGMEFGPFNWDIEDVYDVDLSLGNVTPTVTVKPGVISWQTSTEYHSFFFFEANWPAGNGAFLKFTLAHSGWIPVFPFPIPAEDIDVTINNVSAKMKGFCKVVIPKSTLKPTLTMTVQSVDLGLSATASLYFLDFDITDQVKTAVDGVIFQKVIDKGFKLSL